MEGDAEVLDVRSSDEAGLESVIEDILRRLRHMVRYLSCLKDALSASMEDSALSMVTQRQ